MTTFEAENQKQPITTILDGYHGDIILTGPLSQRELEILHLIAAGCRNREIAERLSLAPSTVKWYCRHMYQKLDVLSRTQAIARARELNLLS